MKSIFFLIAISLLLAASVMGQGSSATGSTATAPAPKESKRGPIFRPTKDQIMQVQKLLIEKKLYNGEATGKYDNETRAGIKSFQKDNGLKETGTLNRATLEKFGVELTASQKAIPASPGSYATPEKEQPGARSTSEKSSSSTAAGQSSPRKTIFRATADQIKAAQKLLRSKSLYSGDETGKLDDATREGLKKYQDANGLKVTGTLNQVTLEKMGIELTEKQKADSAASSATPNKTQ
jgi:peptidoglycan hydrolase-like protein with peptidoglycan-binding domain